jgi:hypothetical protein
MARSQVLVTVAYAHIIWGDIGLQKIELAARPGRLDCSINGVQKVNTRSEPMTALSMYFCSPY